MEKGVGTYTQYPYWAKGPATIEDGFIVLDEERAEPYFMFEPPNLFFDLLDVYKKPDALDPRDVVSFVRRYGLLHHGNEHLGTGECREPLATWDKVLLDMHVHAQMYLGIKETEKSGPTPQMRETFELVRRSVDDPAFTDHEILENVSVYLAERISEKMQDTKAGLMSTCQLDVSRRGPSTFFLAQLPSNLLAAAYGQFAGLIADKKPIADCSGCGRLFNPASGKQKYCTPACASTNRWRKWKKRQAE